MKKLIIVMMVFTILILASCGPPPIEVDADYVLVGFEDNSIITLDKGTTEFTEIAKEAIRVYQHVGLSTECYFGAEDIEAIKHNNKFIEIGFDEPIDLQHLIPS